MYLCIQRKSTYQSVQYEWTLQNKVTLIDLFSLKTPRTQLQNEIFDFHLKLETYSRLSLFITEENSIYFIKLRQVLLFSSFSSQTESAIVAALLNVEQPFHHSSESKPQAVKNWINKELSIMSLLKNSHIQEMKLLVWGFLNCIITFSVYCSDVISA